MEKIAAVIYTDDPASPALPEILAGLEEEGVPGEVVPEGGDCVIKMAKAASLESVFGCGIGLRAGYTALYAEKTLVMPPSAAAPRLAGKNAALYIKRERFELA
ncbi:MAG: glycerol dehydratase reactivase beta/small subunit family protein [Firmicutes bacterium]|nr:glycerol dehydratase reactivase beta/small subunit family protein [Bacillota bacterium]